MKQSVTYYFYFVKIFVKNYNYFAFSVLKTSNFSLRFGASSINFSLVSLVPVVTRAFSQQPITAIVTKYWFPIFLEFGGCGEPESTRVSGMVDPQWLKWSRDTKPEWVRSTLVEPQYLQSNDRTRSWFICETGKGSICQFGINCCNEVIKTLKIKPFSGRFGPVISVRTVYVLVNLNTSVPFKCCFCNLSFPILLQSTRNLCPF